MMLVRWAATCLRYDEKLLANAWFAARSLSVLRGESTVLTDVLSDSTGRENGQRLKAAHGLDLDCGLRRQVLVDFLELF